MGSSGSALATASPFAARSDALFFSLVLLSAIVIGAIVLTQVYFCVRYRAGNNTVDRRNPVRSNRAIEYTWILAPLAIFFGIFGWAATLYAGLFRAAPDALQIFVVGKQWMWEIQHPEGRRELNALHLPVGRPVELTITSQDVVHSFFVPALRIKRDAVPGTYTTLAFTPTETGVFDFYCSEYCGTSHSKMTGTLTVMEPRAYARWLSGGEPTESMASQGAALFVQYGCNGCHGSGSSVPAPDLHGLYGRLVHLQSGRSLIADDLYIRDSILLAKKDVTAGFTPIMPSFQGQIDEREVLELIEYIKSLPETQAQ